MTFPTPLMRSLTSRWPRWLHTLTAVLVVAWVIHLLPTFGGAASACVASHSFTLCSLNLLLVVISALESILFYSLGWIVFLLCALEDGRHHHEWKKWAWIGGLCAFIAAAIGGILSAPLYAPSASGPGLLSPPFILGLLSFALAGFALGLLILFPVPWALHIAHRKRKATPAKGAMIGAAVGLSYSALSLVVIPFAVVLGSTSGFFSQTSLIFSLLSHVQPLALFLPNSWVVHSTLSPIFAQNLGTVHRMLGLPLFLLSHATVHILVFSGLGWVWGWMAAKRKKVA